MGETVDVEKAKKKSWFESWYKGLKSEFNKIVWPTKEALVKKTLAVVLISVALGLIITGFDTVIQFGIDILVK